MKHLLKLMDLSREDIISLLNQGDQMKYDLQHGLQRPVLAGKTLAMVFRKASTRTRVSFETGMFQLGGHALYISETGSQLGRGEPVEDTARVLSRYCDGIMIRTYEQAEVESYAAHGSIPVINGLTDFAHPCQVLADLMTIREKLSVLEGVTLCYIGDGNNMANSLIAGGLLCGMTVKIAAPAGYEPHADILAFTKKFSSFYLTQDPREAAEKADVLVTDVWASMGMEADTDRRMKDFAGFQINKELMALAQPGAMVQHCLPAHRGEEITAEIFEEHASEIFDEAENRLHIQKAVLAALMS